jgi:hypothetical protein
VSRKGEPFKIQYIIYFSSSDVSNVKPVQDAMHFHSNLTHSISCSVSNSQCDALQQELSPIANVELPLLSGYVNVR